MAGILKSVIPRSGFINICIRILGIGNLSSGICHQEFFEEPAMARPARSQPTEGELEILKVLWEQGPSELKQVCAAVRRDRLVATTTVATMLKLMQEKGLVERGEAARGSVYSARVSRTAASTSLVHRLMDLVFDGSARRLVAHMLETEKLSARDRAEIRRLLDEDDARTAHASRPRRKKGGQP
jgi:predicted transcriptional regulator